MVERGTRNAKVPSSILGRGFWVSIFFYFFLGKKEIVMAVRRAKVYCLNEDGQWDDKGTGLAAVQYMQVSSHTLNPYHADVCSESLSKQQAEETAFIVLVSEENSDILMKVRVRSDENIYARQQGAHRVKHCSQPHQP